MTEENDQEVVKKISFIMRKPPHGEINAYEGMEVMLIMAAYDQDLSIIFIDDGVLVLKKNQDTSQIGIKEFSKTLRVLPDYDVEKLYVERESLEERGLTVDDLVIDVEVKDRTELTDYMKGQDTLLPF